MNYFKPGAWNVICQVCGRKFKSEETRKRWDGLIVCHSDYETRHILDFLKVREDDPAVPYVAPEPTDTFVGLSCPYPTSAGMADIGTADCAIAGSSLNIVAVYTPSSIAGVAIAGTALPTQEVSL